MMRANHQIIKKQWCVMLLFGVLLNSCTLSQSTGTIQDQNGHPSAQQSQDRRVEEPLALTLLSLLQREQHIAKPFAWGGPEDKPIVIGINQEAKLKTIFFSKTSDGYAVDKSNPFPSEEDQAARIEKSDSLDLRDHLNDREFPFKSSVITMGTCQVHFILIHKALERSLQNTIGPLTSIDIKIIAEKDSQVISNKAVGLSFLGVKEAFVKDINGDGKQEYGFIGEDNSQHIYIWTVEPDCAVKPLLFKFQGKKEEIKDRSISGRELFLKFDRSNNSYDIHTRHSEPYIENGKTYWRITESIYKWDNQDSLYKQEKEFSRLKRAD